MVNTELKNRLDCLYERYNDPQYINPDPLVFVYHYTDHPNREMAGFIAACFAYGRVEMIMKTVDRILTGLGPDPARPRALYCLCTRLSDR